MYGVRRWLATALALGVAAAGPASAATGAVATGSSPTVLDRYLDTLTTLRTDFTQTVSDAGGKITQNGEGSLIVSRPDRFRWDYRPANAAGAVGNTGGGDDSGELLVADGKNLWFFDRELAQVTVKPIDAALSATPIVLLSGSAALLRAQFQIESEPARESLQWVQVRPRSAQADFSSAELGFRDGELVRMRVHNMLGQIVQLDFTNSHRNTAVDAALFHFTVPAGVDVIGTPQPTPGP
jgi:outer membrane lipoprotein carrier protein